MKEIGIYVHIPFCKRKCYYCDFVSYADKDDKIEKYVSTMFEEIDYVRTNFTDDHIVNTIYFGGGTPSYLDSIYIKGILEKILMNFNISPGVEITLEVNPGTINEEKLKTYQMCGINRLSIGLQTTSDKLLKTIGRIHTYTEFLSTYNLARKQGFNNINVDLMFGLPNQSLEDVRDDLRRIIDLSPEHISTYSLIVEDGTKLQKMLGLSGEKVERLDEYKKNKAEKLTLPSEEIERQMYWEIKKKLEENGYKHYEVSNFAKEGFESKHNTDCWKQKEYLGFGAAAHSYLDGVRSSNSKVLTEYMLNYKNKKVEEKLNQEESAKEYMMLGLRMLKGISISEFQRKFNLNPIVYFRFEISKLVEEDLIEVDLDDIRLTEKGLDFANRVWQEFV